MKRRFGARWLLWCALLLFSGATEAAARSYPMDTMAPRSDLAELIQSVYVQVTLWDLLVLVVVIVALFLAIFWFSTRFGEPGEEPVQFHSHMGLEVAWTAGPILILVLITVPTVRAVFNTQPYHWPKEALTVRVIAHQWWWEFRYPSLGAQTANEVHIPADRMIHFELESADVIHSFWMPALGGKRDVVPGQINQITLVAKVPGEYYGQCAEFCGASHANMRFRVFVDTAEGFQRWVADQLKPPVMPASGLASEGARIYQNAPCAICHRVKGISGFSKQYEGGFRGPDLTHFAGRSTLAAGVLDNTPDNLATWIQDPQTVKPGALMPRLGLKGHELTALVAYLESLK